MDLLCLTRIGGFYPISTAQKPKARGEPFFRHSLRVSFFSSTYDEKLQSRPANKILSSRCSHYCSGLREVGRWGARWRRYLAIDTGGFRPVEVLDQEDADSVQNSTDRNNFTTATKTNDQAIGDIFEDIRTQSGPRIVQQLTGTYDGTKELTEELIGDDVELRDLYNEVQRLAKYDRKSAFDLLDENYDVLSDQIKEGVKGVEQIIMLNVLASLYSNADDDAQSEKVLRQARDLVGSITESSNRVCMLLEHLAHMFSRISSPEESLPLFLKSLEMRKKQPGVDGTSVIKTMLGLANTYSELNELEKSTELYREVIRYAEHVLGPEDEDLAAPLLHLGSTLLETGKLDEGELSVERALMVAQKSYGPKDGRCGIATCVLAQAKSYKGQFNEAATLYRKGLQIMEGCSDYSKRPLATLYADLAAMYTVLGRDNEAEEILRELSMDDTSLAQYYDFQLVQHFQKLSEIHANARDFDKAEVALRRCLELLVENVGLDSPQAATVLQALATVINFQPGRKLEAESFARQALRVLEATNGIYHPIVGEACSCLSSILHDMARDDEAVELMWRVLAIQEKAFGYSHPEIVETLEILSMLLMRLERYDDTMPIIQRLKQLKFEIRQS